MRHNSKFESLVGLSVASVIVFLWIGSLAFLLSIDFQQLTAVEVVVALLGRTLIQTGLFIVAHDAIHGVVFPRDRRLNHAIGHLCVTLYAFLSYKTLSFNHWKHHRFPGQDRDPDFHDGTHKNPVFWYLKFMREYLDIKQAIIVSLGTGTTFLTLHWMFHCSIAALLWFWMLPIVFSSIQLFWFGTYLPHGAEHGDSPHNAVSSSYPPLLSLLTCYHFGYHWEHHEYPFLAWYQLPRARWHRLQNAPSPVDRGKSIIVDLAARYL